MNLLLKATVKRDRATEVDFCRLFELELDRLYSLALLLTADSKLAEECFEAGLRSCLSTAWSVFQSSALRWSKHVVIKTAIRVLTPNLSGISRAGCTVQMKSPLAQAIVELDHFSRLVFVISILEGYSDREAALLLNCTLQELMNARSGALQQVATVTVAGSTATRLAHRLTIDVSPPSDAPMSDATGGQRQ